MPNANAVADRIKELRLEQQRLLHAAVELDSDEIIEDQIATLDTEIIELQCLIDAMESNVVKLR